MCYKIKTRVGRFEFGINVWSPNEISELGWSLARLQTQKDVQEQWTLSSGVRDALTKMGVHRAHAPNVAEFSARIIDPCELKMIELGGGVCLGRNKSVPSDGIFLKKGHAFVMSSAGCPIIIASSRDRVIVAHAGRGSMLDTARIRGESGRANESIVHAIVDSLKDFGASEEDIEMSMHLSIPTALFEHPLNGPYGSHNRMLFEYVEQKWPSAVTRRNGSMFLDLESLFDDQAREAGVLNTWAANSLSEFPALVHTRDCGDTRKRNLVVVKRKT